MPFKNPIVGGTTLVRAAINSPNYVPGVSGWIIDADGSAEFNTAVVRGDLIVGVGNPLSGVEATATVPAELTAYYLTFGGSVVAGGLLKLGPGDGSYTYLIALEDPSSSASQWSLGVVDPSLTVHPHITGQFLPGLGLSNIDIGNGFGGAPSSPVQIFLNGDTETFSDLIVDGNGNGLTGVVLQNKAALVIEDVVVTDPMTSYFPNWTGTTNPVIGNGSLTGFFMLLGHMCDFYVVMTAGSTTTFGTGPYTFTTPFVSAAPTGFTYGRASLALSAAAVRLSRQAWQNAGQGIALSDEAGTRVTNTVPLALTNGSIIVISGRYPIT